MADERKRPVAEGPTHETVGLMASAASGTKAEALPQASMSYTSDTLNTALNATTDNVVALTTGSATSKVGDLLQIEQEQMRVTQVIDANNLKVTRGANGTAVAAHAAGATVRLNTPAVAQQSDIFPRPPLDTTGYQDLSVAQWDFPPGLAGMIVDTGIKDLISRVSETDSAPIGFGTAVMEGSKNGYCKAPAGSARILGISVMDWTGSIYDPLSGGLNGYRGHWWSVGILRVGRIWTQPTTAVKRGNPVCYADTTGLLADGTGTQIPGATWDSDAAAGEMAVVQINLNK